VLHCIHHRLAPPPATVSHGFLGDFDEVTPLEVERFTKRIESLPLIAPVAVDRE
jgi:hypothetical protein